MKLIGALDPGKRACGLSLTKPGTGELLSAWLVKSPEQEADGAPCWLAMGMAVRASLLQEFQRLGLEPRLELLVVERQRIYRHTKNPNVILDLAYTVGVVLGQVPARRVAEVQQSTWGKSLGKEASNDAVWDALEHYERARARGAQLASTGHNVKDAIGIGKWAASGGGMHLWQL